MSQTKPQLFKFQITGYEESNPDTYMLGLGTIDDQNRFTGTLKHENYNRDLSKPAEYDAESGPVCAWLVANYYTYYGYYYTVLVSSLPITNISLVEDENVDPIPRTLDPDKKVLPTATINADLLEALEAMCSTFGYKSYMTRDLDPEITTEAVLIKARNAITKAKGL